MNYPSRRTPLHSLLLCTLVLICLQVGITVSGVAQTQSTEKPLKLETIEKLIAIKAPSLVLLIRTRGIDFPLDESILQRLQKLGASRAVIEALKEVEAPTLRQDKRLSIRVAEFTPVGVKVRPVTQILMDQLSSATNKYPDLSIKSLGEPVTAEMGGDYAKAKGKELGADIVIWGWYSGEEEKILVNVHFEVLRAPSNLSLAQNMKTFDMPMSDFKDFNLQIQTPLSSQMSYLTLLTLGLARLEAEDFDGATATFTKALSLPSVPDTMVAPADIYFYRALSHFRKSFLQLADETDLAIADLNMAIQIDPNYAYAHLILSTAYLLKGEFEKALETLDKAIALSPDDVLLLLQRGGTYLAKGEPIFASRDCNRALDLLAHNDKTEPATLPFLRYSGHFCSQDFVSAISDVTKAIDVEKDKEARAFFLFLRAGSYLASDQNEKAINDATQALKLKPDLLRAYQIRATAYGELENYTAALADANHLLQLSPTNGIAYWLRGEFHRENGDLKDADVDYGRALALDPELGFAYVGRARVYQELKEYEKAIIDFDNALYAKKPDPEGLLYRGLMFERMKQYDKALTDYDEYVKRVPNDENGYSFRASAYNAKGETTKAITDYGRAIEVSPTSKNYCDRGLAYFNLRDYERALTDFNNVLKADPKYFNALLYRGLLFQNKGDFDRAIPDFTAVLQLAPNWDFILLRRAVAYARTSDRVHALSDLKKCLRVTTNDSNRKEAQDEIDKLQPKRTPAPVKSKLSPKTTIH